MEISMEYTIKLEQENKHLKNLLNRANQEIDRLVAKRVQAREETCEWWLTEDGYVDHDGELQDEYPPYCPRCGGKIYVLDETEKNIRAYNMHIESEIDWRRELAMGA